jgi:hypothetical protein
MRFRLVSVGGKFSIKQFSLFINFRGGTQKLMKIKFEATSKVFSKLNSITSSTLERGRERPLKSVAKDEGAGSNGNEKCFMCINLCKSSIDLIRRLHDPFSSSFPVI